MAENGRVLVVEVIFWVAAGLLVYAQVGYPVLLAVFGRLRRGRGVAESGGPEPRVSLIVAAHREAEVI